MMGNGSTLFVILKWNLMALSSHPCDYSQDGKYYHADCSKRDTINVPETIPSNITSLDLSFNKVKNLDETYFMRIHNLVKLRMVDMKKQDNNEEGITQTAFRNLLKLEFLDVSGTPFTAKMQEWAPNLKVLVVNNASAPELPVANLKLLEELYANDNELEAFPKFNHLAPLKVIEVQNNPIKEIEVSDISPFCRLSSLGLKFRLNRDFQRDSNYCNCKKLQLWLKTYNIKSNPLNCAIPYYEGVDVECKTEFTPHELNLRQDCLSRLNPNLWNATLLISLMISLMVASLILVGYVYLRKFKRTRKDNDDNASPDYDEDHDDYDEE